MALREWFDNRRQLPRRNAVSIFLDLEDRFALLVRGRQTNATFLLRKLFTAFKTKFSTICLSASSSARIGVRHVGTLSCRSIPPSRAGYENCPVHVFEQGTKVNLFFINLPFPSLNRRYIVDIVYEIENLSAKYFRDGGHRTTFRNTS